MNKDSRNITIYCRNCHKNQEHELVKEESSFQYWKCRCNLVRIIPKTDPIKSGKILFSTRPDSF